MKPARIGKRVRGALYVHAEAVRLLEPEQHDRVRSAAQLAVAFAWNVARLEPDCVGLLRYAEFEDDAFPRLEAAARVGLSPPRVTLTNFHGSRNPLILHRKELLVRPDHPDRNRWADTTLRAKNLGLFAHPERIGRLHSWNKLLLAAGLDEQGRELTC